MKKKIFLPLLIELVILVLISMILIGIFKKNGKEYEKIKIGDSDWKVHSLYSNSQMPLGRLGIDIYRISEGYLIVTYDQGVKTVGVLSPKSEWIYWLGSSPITFDYELDYDKIKTFDEIEAIYGKDWIETGSGYIMPAYITDEGKIIYFDIDLEKGNLYGIGETDIMKKDGKEIFEREF